MTRSLNPVRLWRVALSWLELHPRVTALLTVLALAAVAVLAAFTFSLHSDENAKLAAQRAAQTASDQARATAARQTSAAIRKALCPLVYGYVHPVPGSVPTSRTAQVDLLWHAVGGLIGCPDGIPPEGR